MNKDPLIEYMNHMENILTLMQDKRDIWQNEIIYLFAKNLYLIDRRLIKDGEKV